jgi:hypothetical protein
MKAQQTRNSLSATDKKGNKRQAEGQREPSLFSKNMNIPEGCGWRV